MEGDKYDGGAGDYVFFKGGYKYQLSDYPPCKYIGTSDLTEGTPGNVNSDGQISGNFEISVYNSTLCHGIATRRKPITLETRDKRKNPKSIR